jgi:hypothetical protein
LRFKVESFKVSGFAVGSSLRPSTPAAARLPVHKVQTQNTPSGTHLRSAGPGLACGLAPEAALVLAALSSSDMASG